MGMAHQINKIFTLRQIGRTGACIAIGYFAWNGSILCLAFLPLLILIWSRSRNRLEVFLALLAYYLAASRGLLHGANVFFNYQNSEPNVAYGILAWLTPNIILAAVWTIGWSLSKQSLRLVVVLLILSFPPIGVIGWANPITSACALFPGLGWLGLGLTLLLLLFIRSHQKYRLLLLPLMAIAITANAMQLPPSTPYHWVSINTTYRVPNSHEDEFFRMQDIQKMVLSASKLSPPETIFLLPEAIGGNWSINKIWWESTENILKQKKQTALIGARHHIDKQKYINMLVSIGDKAGITFVNRAPIPIGMWNPFQENSAIPAWLENGTQEINKLKVAALICYEQLLIWPVLLSFSKHPHLLIGASNHWWANHTSIPKIQRQVLSAWGRLFNIGTVYAENI